MLLGVAGEASGRGLVLLGLLEVEALDEVELAADYRDVLDQIDEMSVELPELRESFVKLVQAGIEAQKA